MMSVSALELYIYVETHITEVHYSLKEKWFVSGKVAFLVCLESVLLERKEWRDSHSNQYRSLHPKLSYLSTPAFYMKGASVHSFQTLF